jgi:hypothetical protein
MPRIIASLLLVALASCNSSSSGEAYSISGTVLSGTGPFQSHAGVLISLAGPASASTTTDAAGSYVFGGLASGTYTLTPALAGFAFAPPSLSVTLAGANVSEEDFTCQCASGGQTQCGSSCVELSADPVNCGACNHACGLGTCTASQCTCSASPPTVTLCPNSPATGTCVDLNADSLNCGTCDHACGLGTCTASRCTCNSSPPTVKLCRDKAGVETCVDTASNPSHCGNCGWSCTYTYGPTYVCRNSYCTCPPGASMCDSGCAFVESDPSNCGHCGIVCPAPKVCKNGQCG